MVHEENQDTVGKAMELFVLRLITDVETINHMNIDDMDSSDFRYVENL